MFAQRRKAAKKLSWRLCAVARTFSRQQITMSKAYMNWSGGKDSALALHKIQSGNEFDIEVLLTNVNAAHNRISMHGVRRTLLEEQARAIGIPLETIELPEQPEMNEYEDEMRKKVSSLKKRGLDHAIFGDIFLEDLRKYREEKLSELSIQAVFPLWQIDTQTLIREFLRLNFKAIVVCVNEAYLDKSFCGRIIDDSFVKDLPPGVDVCGEDGEYHSFVFDGPIFMQPVNFKVGEIVRRTYPAPKLDGQGSSEYGFYFCDIY